ncbi:hypothetical protein J6590_044863 [Homalodisca vitripennis]|nr:hypothetical protein J6590_044863 [Homalodisca vitripennis]
MKRLSHCLIRSTIENETSYVALSGSGNRSELTLPIENKLLHGSTGPDRFFLGPRGTYVRVPCPYYLSIKSIAQTNGRKDCPLTSKLIEFFLGPRRTYVRVPCPYYLFMKSIAQTNGRKDCHLTSKLIEFFLGPRRTYVRVPCPYYLSMKSIAQTKGRKDCHLTSKLIGFFLGPRGTYVRVPYERTEGLTSTLIGFFLGPRGTYVRVPCPYYLSIKSIAQTNGRKDCHLTSKLIGFFLGPRGIYVRHCTDERTEGLSFDLKINRVLSWTKRNLCKSSMSLLPFCQEDCTDERTEGLSFDLKINRVLPWTKRNLCKSSMSYYLSMKSIAQTNGRKDCHLTSKLIGFFLGPRGTYLRVPCPTTILSRELRRRTDEDPISRRSCR